MDEIKVLEELFDSKVIRILKAMLKDTGKQFYLQELSREAKVPMATCSRVLAKLAKLEIVEVSKISRFKLYKLQSNKKVELLSDLFKEDQRIVENFVERIKALPGLKAVILHGKEQTDRANILLIGDDMDPGEVKTVCAEIREQYNFVISPLSLTEEQYEQMSSMGLYSGQKKVLFEK